MTVRETVDKYRAQGGRLSLSKAGQVFADPRLPELNEFLKKNYRDVVALLRAERVTIDREKLIALAAELGIDSLEPDPVPVQPVARQTKPASSADAYNGPRTRRILLG